MRYYINGYRATRETAIRAVNNETVISITISENGNVMIETA